MVNPDFFITSTTRISPMTVITVVEVVGVSPNGQTSFGLPVLMQTLDSLASGLFGLPVMTMNLRAGLRMCARLVSSTISRVFSGIGYHQQQIVLLKDAQVAVLGFAGMKENSGCACRAKCRGDVHRNLSCLAHSRSDELSALIVNLFNNHIYCLFEGVGYRYIEHCLCLFLKNIFN
jgi:hypothetical protein